MYSIEWVPSGLNMDNPQAWNQFALTGSKIMKNFYMVELSIRNWRKSVDIRVREV